LPHYARRAGRHLSIGSTFNKTGFNSSLAAVSLLTLLVILRAYPAGHAAILYPGVPGLNRNPALGGLSFRRRPFIMAHMRRPSLRWPMLLVLISMFGPANAQTLGSPPAPRSAPRTDANSQIAHRQLLQKARQGRIDLYFAGDSTARRWGASDAQYQDLLANWNRNFIGWNAANFGWGGDTVQNILWRLENGELDDVHPKVIVLLAGTNNLGGKPPPEDPDPRIEEVTGGIRAILDFMKRKAPRATIILMGLTPRNDPPNGTAIMPTIDRINARLARLADGRQIRFLNLNDKLADPNGKLFEGMTVDGLHLSLKGYQIWADALKPLLEQLLGPRASTDQAPPPTGDPSAQQPVSPRP
jgi:lysophospholipase L1-like esterase